MYLRDITVYPVQIIKNSKIIFDDVADNLPNELKDYEITNSDFKDNKLILEIKPE